MNRKDGGPAFPSDLDEGLSMRDYFAGQALAGFCARMRPLDDIQSAASAAYRYADAMIAAREEKK